MEQKIIKHRPRIGYEFSLPKPDMITAKTEADFVNEKRTYEKIKTKPGYSDHFCPIDIFKDKLVFDNMGNDLTYMVNHDDPVKPKGGTGLAVGRSIIAAIQWLHTHGIAHGDIKPENIIVVPGQPPTARLIDLECALSEGQHRQQQCGTINYLPPELVDRQTQDYEQVKAYDLWALGLVLMYILDYNDKLKWGIKKWSDILRAKKTKDFVHDNRDIFQDANRILNEKFRNLNLLATDPETRGVRAPPLTTDNLVFSLAWIMV